MLVLILYVAPLVDADRLMKKKRRYLRSICTRTNLILLYYTMLFETYSYAAEDISKLLYYYLNLS